MGFYKLISRAEVIICCVMVLTMHTPGMTQVFDIRNIKEATTEVYDVVQDQKGYLWIATETGLKKYDGTHFTHFTSKQGLPDNSILKLYIDQLNRIWFSTNNGMVGYVLNDSIYVPPFNENLKKLSRGLHFHYMAVDTNLDLWLTSLRGNLFKVSHYGQITKEQTVEGSLYDAIWLKSFDGALAYTFTNPPGRLKKTGATENKGEILIYYKNERFFQYKVDLVELNKNEFLVSFEDYIYHIKNGKLLSSKQLFKGYVILDMYIDDHKYIWISVDSKGIYIYNSTDFDQALFHILKGHAAGRIIQDHEFNYWIASTGKGLFFLPSVNYKIIPETYNKKIISQAITDDHIFYSWYLHGLYALRHKSNKSIKFKSSEVMRAIYSLKTINNNRVITSGPGYIFDSSGNLLNQYEFKSFVRYIAYARDSGLHICTNGSYCKYDKYLKPVFKYGTGFYWNVRAIYEDPNGTVWIGSNNGLYTYDQHELHYWGDSNKYFSRPVSAITGNQDDDLFIGTTTHGLMIKQGNKLLHLSESNGLPSNIVKCLLLENGSDLWIGSNKGIAKLHIENNSPFKYSLENYSNNGPASIYEVYGINQHDSLIYLATEKGIIYFCPKHLKKQNTAPLINLGYVLVNEHDTFFDTIPPLAHNHNNLSFFYQAISYSQPDQIQYYFRLKGFENNWVQTTNSSTRYTNLPPGHYVFEVKATIDSLESKLIRLPLQIEKHYSQTAVFQIFLVICIGTFLFLVIKLMTHYTRKKEATKRKSLQVENKALRMQMNPHFVFNSMGAIQRFILESKSEEANDYLSDFAMLMRIILESSKKNFIPLKEEINTLNLYLYLESKRFKKGFDFQITTSHDLEPAMIKTPPLLVQPLIENAIWHGLMHKNDKGFIHINFSKHSNELLLCEISDNGVGRSRAKTYKHGGIHQETGIANIKERIALINKMYHTQMQIEFSDLSPEEEDTGTHIKILIYYIN